MSSYRPLQAASAEPGHSLGRALGSHCRVKERRTGSSLSCASESTEPKVPSQGLGRPHGGSADQGGDQDQGRHHGPGRAPGPGQAPRTRAGSMDQGRHQDQGRQHGLGQAPRTGSGTRTRASTVHQVGHQDQGGHRRSGWAPRPGQAPCTRLGTRTRVGTRTRASSLQTGDRRVRPRLGLRHGTPLASRDVPGERQVPVRNHSGFSEKRRHAPVSQRIRLQ